MIDRNWQAYIAPEPSFFTSRLVIGRECMAGRIEVVLGDGTMTTFAAGEATPPGAGIILPSDSLDAVVKAISKARGEATHSETEARVLREWPDSERGRVDDVLRILRGAR